MTLTKAIRHDIESLGVRLSDLSNQSEGRKRLKNQDEIKGVVHDIKDLLEKIEDVCFPKWLIDDLMVLTYCI